jgi:hypothetical protein
MAFSAGDWRDRLAAWSGSAQGAYSWSELGKSTSQGQYFLYWSLSGTTLYQTYAGVGGGSGAKNPDPYYVDGAVVYFFQVVYYDIDYSATSYANTTNYEAADYYVTQGNYNWYVTAVNPNDYTYYYICCTSVVDVYYSYAFYDVNYISPTTFYNYAPWGNGPYSAGNNISIGAGNGPFSGYPKQTIT